MCINTCIRIHYFILAVISHRTFSAQSISTCLTLYLVLLSKVDYVFNDKRVVAVRSDLLTTRGHHYGKW